MEGKARAWGLRSKPVGWGLSKNKQVSVAGVEYLGWRG